MIEAWSTITFFYNNILMQHVMMPEAQTCDLLQANTTFLARVLASQSDIFVGPVARTPRKVALAINAAWSGSVDRKVRLA